MSCGDCDWGCTVNDCGKRMSVCAEHYELALRQAESACRVQSNVGTGPDAISDLERRVAKMRELGVTKWGDIELGPAPADTATTTTQQPKSLDEQMRETRARQRDLALAASGSLVRRLGENRE